MPLTDYLIGGSSATVISTGAGALVLRQLKRVAADAVREGVQTLTDDVAAFKLKFAAETGGNSNGLRQAVNTIGRDVSDLKASVAGLNGALTTHLQENSH